MLGYILHLPTTCVQRYKRMCLIDKQQFQKRFRNLNVFFMRCKIYAFVSTAVNDIDKLLI